MNRYLIGKCLIFLIPLMLHARPADYFVAGSSTYSGITLPFRLFIPANYSPNVKYPIVLTLHGSGECGTDNWVQIANNRLAEIWAEDTNQARNPCFVFSPQIPDWDHRFPNVDMNQGNGYNFNSTPETNCEANIMHCLDSLIHRYSIDTNRIYATGLSMGGWGTWDLIIRFPNKFAAGIPMSGGGDSSQIERIRSIPVWNFHGGADPVVPVSNSQEMATAYEHHGINIVRVVCNLDNTGGNISRTQLKSLIDGGANVLYTEYIGAGHGIWTNAYDDPYLPGWLFSKSKAPNNGVVISNFTASPSSFMDTSAVTVTFSATIAGTVNSVAIDLSPLGGSSSASMIAGANNSYSYSFLVNSGAAAGVKNIALHAVNTIGTKDAFVNITVNELPKPTTTQNIYTDAESYPGLSAVKIGANTPTEISTGAQEGTKCYSYPFTLNNYWDGFSLVVNNWNGTIDMHDSDTLQVAYKGPGNGYTLGLQLYPKGSPNPVPSSWQPYSLPNTSSWAVAKVPLKYFTNQGRDLSVVYNIEFDIGGQATGSGTVYIDNVKLIKIISQTSVSIPSRANLSSREYLPAARLQVYSLNGRLVKTIDREINGQGLEEIRSANGLLGLGVYIASASGSKVKLQRMITIGGRK